MADLQQDLGDKIKGLAGAWTAYTALITLPRGDVKEIKIIAYDPILRVLFAEPASQTLPQLESEKGGRQ